MRCVWTRKRLGAYIDQELESPHRRAVAAHVDTCPSCRAQLTRHLSLEEALDMLPVPQVPEGLTERVMNNARLDTRPHRWRRGLGLGQTAILRLGAAATVALAVVVGWTLGDGVATPADPTTEAGSTFYEGTEWFSAAPPGSVPAGYLALVKTAAQPGRKP